MTTEAADQLATLCRDSANVAGSCRMEGVTAQDWDGATGLWRQALD